ncbi:MAG: sigma-70 family RNA polymerase sigma factor [Hyphomicrobiaceae bacterium]|jgi:RNA polymerase sigma-70 factor, ECF subfamily|nr:sigma-70 family RNA polymerase sigma factor [Hyphomicrobiaceae bacterium]
MSGLQALEDRLRTRMLAALAGDAGAYRLLLSDLSEHLRRYYRRRLPESLSANADDLVQETLLAIHARRMTYDTNRAFTAWAYAIARYKLIDALRKSRHKQHVPIESVAEFLADEAAPDGPAGDLAAMLHTLPEKTRGLIYKVKIEGHSVADVAQSAGMSQSAVKVAIHRGVKSLVSRFGGKNDR